MCSRYPHIHSQFTEGSPVATHRERQNRPAGVRKARRQGPKISVPVSGGPALSEPPSAGLPRHTGPAYLRGRTASFNCLAIRALTTVLAGILMASPVAGLRPIRALRF